MSKFIKADPTGTDPLNPLVPSGAIILWPESLPVPAGWAVCDGKAGRLDLTKDAKKLSVALVYLVKV